jgi:hypothetical protein
MTTDFKNSFGEKPMKELILHSTSLAQWYTLVNEAEDFFDSHLETDLESYLVFLLQRYSDKPEMISSIMGVDYLESLATLGKLRTEKLREVGDKCLLFSGFFPELATKRLVTINYFVSLGRSAYSNIAFVSQQGCDLYALLQEHFIHLLDLLLSIRELTGQGPALSLLQARSLWQSTGSLYALKALKHYGQDSASPPTSSRGLSTGSRRGL